MKVHDCEVCSLKGHCYFEHLADIANENVTVFELALECEKDSLATIGSQLLSTLRSGETVAGAVMVALMGAFELGYVSCRSDLEKK